MSIIKWTPLVEPFDEMERFFDDFKMPTNKGFIPAVDIYQDGNNVIIQAPLAGIDPKDVDISVENDTLIIRGQTQKESEVDDKNYYRKEIRSGSFHRAIPLPANVVAEKAQAEFKEGMLKITVPKIEASQPQSIKINIEKK
ncbi:MAG: Hsp20/alpha crystallin family protein [Candidatus Buchananbacteria bacterium]